MWFFLFLFEFLVSFDAERKLVASRNSNSMFETFFRKCYDSTIVSKVSEHCELDYRNSERVSRIFFDFSDWTTREPRHLQTSRFRYIRYFPRCCSMFFRLHLCIWYFPRYSWRGSTRFQIVPPSDPRTYLPIAIWRCIIIVETKERGSLARWWPLWTTIVPLLYSEEGQTNNRQDQIKQILWGSGSNNKPRRRNFVIENTHVSLCHWPDSVKIDHDTTPFR